MKFPVLFSGMGGDVRLTMSEIRLLVKVEAERYRKARKKEKGRILDDLIALSGYNRWYAVGLLRGQGKAIKVGRRLRLVGDLGRSTQRRRPRIYDGVVLEWLRKIWAILDFVCGKRLAAIIPEETPETPHAHFRSSTAPPLAQSNSAAETNRRCAHGPH
ncbi:MAG: hypothetical protein Q7R45_00365 [Sulfuricaulis sp.]|nr:hypothetical protein [Sulfuricaulis sp.]